MLRCAGIFFFLVYQLSCLAQSFKEEDYTRYTKLDGLSNNYITGIVQDSSGYIWIATNKGLNRFDGRSFTNIFKHSEGSPLPQNLILSIGLHNKNEIVGTTVAGGFFYNTLSHQHQRFIIPADSLIAFWTNHAWQVLKDKKGNYVFTTKTGLYIFNPAGKIITRYDHYTPNDAGRKEPWFGNWMLPLSNGNIFQENNLSGSLYRTAEERIDTFYAAKHIKQLPLPTGKTGDERISFPGLHGDLFLPDKQAGTMDVYDLITGNRTSYPVPISVLSDLDWYSKLFYINDSLMALTSKVSGFYLLQYSAKNKQLRCDEKKYFASTYCTSFLRDHEGRLWIGTKDGLYKQNIRNSFFAAEDLSIQSPSIVNTGVQSVFKTRGKIFVGLKNEGGLLVLNHLTKKIEKQISFQQFGSGTNTIHFILSYTTDTLWLGTGKGIVWLNLDNYSSGQLHISGEPGWMYKTWARAYLKDSRGDIWLSFGELNSVVLFNRNENRFYDLSKSPLLKITFCFSMAEDKNNNIWLAGSGMCRWNRKKKEIDLLIPYPPVSKTLYNFMRILDCDEDNNLWISSFDNEVLQYNCTENKMYLRLNENSMIDGYAVTSSPIINDYIWMGMQNGISAFHIKDYSVKQFNYADGLPSAVVTSYRKGSFYDEPENRFYFGAGRYLISFIPDTKLSNKSLPKFSVEIAGNNKLSPEKVNLPYSQNDVELRFNAINFTDPEENRFAYRMLNEKDSTWHELQTQSVVVLSKLAPGSHPIQLRLYSVNNRWAAQEKTIHIEILPPFWRTAWFIVSVLMFLAAGFYYLHRSRIKRIEQKANLDKLLAQTEMKALHSQMNPHFIFNCLNSIREMILNNETKQASHYLSKFAQLIRITLDNSTQPFVSLKSTIDYLQRYLEMEQIRNNHFTYNIDVDEDLQTANIFLPPMLIQPFIENAIWHGAHPDKTMQLTIAFLQKNHELICVIEDDGIGIETSLKKKNNSINHQSIGISNIKNRIKLLNEKYHFHSTVSIEDKSLVIPENGTGTKVTLHLPAKNLDL